MPAIREEKPSSFIDIVNLLENLQTGRQTPLWFRGCGKNDYELIPSLYRHPTRTKVGEIAKLEGELITRFRQRSDLPPISRTLS